MSSEIKGGKTELVVGAARPETSRDLQLFLSLRLFARRLSGCTWDFVFLIIDILKSIFIAAGGE